jgi:hypothetical protein
MSRARNAHRHKAPNEQPNYSAWKAITADELKQRHQTEATAIAERIWMQFYARGLDPKKAADRAEMVYRGTVPRNA